MLANIRRMRRGLFFLLSWQMVNSSCKYSAMIVGDESLVSGVNVSESLCFVEESTVDVRGHKSL
jgi:hypothetical protein